MKYLRAIARVLGPFGIAGIALTLLCAAFSYAVVEPAEKELTAQQEASRRLKSRSALQPVSIDSRGEDLRRFYALFPSAGKIAPEMQKLWVVAGEYKIDLQQGEYRLESSGPGLVRYRITLPMRASYGQIRQFVGFILKEIPTMSIDGLRFERKKISDTQLDAQIRLTLYLQPAALAVTTPGAP
jgi:hypothetical protein